MNATDRQQAIIDRLTDLLGADAVDLREAERQFFAEDALGRRGDVHRGRDTAGRRPARERRSTSRSSSPSAPS